MPKLVCKLHLPSGGVVGTGAEDSVIRRRHAIFNFKALGPDPGDWGVAIGDKSGRGGRGHPPIGRGSATGLGSNVGIESPCSASIPKNQSILKIVLLKNHRVLYFVNEGADRGLKMYLISKLRKLRRCSMSLLFELVILENNCSWSVHAS